jgi:RNA-directed DNA polymerase
MSQSKKGSIQHPGSAQKSTSLSPQTLRLQLRIKDHTRSKRKHWDLFRYLASPTLLGDALTKVVGNAGSGGVDGLEVKDIMGKEWEFIQALSRKIRDKAYKPKPVRRVLIPKANGKTRPLGIPTLEDRVVQTALVLLLEPIYEELFLECSYGLRPGKRAVDCAADVANLAYKHRHVIDADIESFFDSVVHRKLMGMLKEEIIDPRILDLIFGFLRAGFEEVGKPWQMTTVGTPQGGPLSPLLANIYLHHTLDKKFNSLGSKSAKLIRYADDFVVLVKTKNEAKLLLIKIKEWLQVSGLRLNREKTKLVNLKNRYRGHESKFDFLGFNFHLRTYKDNSKRFWVARQPSEKARVKLRANLKSKLSPNLSPAQAKQVIKSVWVGWTEYFRYANANRVFYKEIDNIHRFIFCYYLRRKYRRQRKPVPWRKLKRLGNWILYGIRPPKVISDLVRLRNQQLHMEL